MRRATLIATLIAVPSIATAAHAETDLPPTDLVPHVLEAQPNVAVAAAHTAGARAEGDALRRGNHEVAVEGGFARRSVDRDRDYSEFDARLSRAFRLPGKAALDRRAAELGVDVAANRQEASRHDAALLLADLWFDWLEAAELHRNALSVVENQRRLVQATERRMTLRDAARLDVEQAGAALALAEAEAAEAAALRDRAQALLTVRFPDLPLPAAPPRIADPAEPPAGLAQLQRLIVERSTDIAAASGDAERREVLARRARADRMADPTLGIRLFSERGGEERGAGLVASLPLGGGYRRALADQAQAAAAAARAGQQETERQVAAEAAADAAELRARLAGWSASRQAVSRAEQSAALTRRGQELGASELSDRLYAERQATETQAREILARSLARRLAVKLEIDAHILWHHED